MSGQRQPQQVPDYTGLNLQTSSMCTCCPLSWGMSRGAPNLIDYVGFEVHKQESGKGGSFFGKSTNYTYSATILLALSEGPIHGIGNIYVNQGVTTGLSQFGFTLFTGTTPQAPWGYLTSNFPTHALGYQGIAYLGAENYNLGSSESLPSQSFEVQGVFYNTGYTGGGDADCAQVVYDFLTNSQYGVTGFDPNRIDTTALNSGPDATTTGDSAYQTYCRAMGWGISPFLQNQEPAITILSRWCQATNTAPVWTGYALRLVPFGDETVTANGVTFIPPTTSQFALTDNDYRAKPGSDPVTPSHSDWFDAYNAVALECRDRGYEYNTVPIDWVDLGAVQLIGRRYAPTIQAHEICVPAMARQVVELIGRRMVYVRNLYTFVVGPEQALPEPMDCGTISVASLNLTDLPVRIREITEQDDGTFLWVVEEFPGTTGTPASVATTGGASAPTNSQVVPGSVNTPAIFEPNSLAAAFLNGGSSAPIVVAAVSAGPSGTFDPNWGGAFVNVSTDGSTYVQIGQIDTPSRMGTLTANLAAYGGSNPDTTNTLSVSLAESDGTLESASSGATAAAGATLCYVDGELIGFETATLTGANAYNLTTLYRGLFGTAAGAHSSGAQFARLDGAVFIYHLPAAYIGQTLYFKFQSFNVWGNQVQDLSTCTAYTYTPTGAGYGGGTGGVPTVPTGLAGVGGVAQNVLTWNANPATDNVASYQLYATAGPGGSFSGATLIYSGPALTYTETGLGTSVDRTYFLIATNAAGSSTHTSGVDVTTSSTAVAGKQPFGYTPSSFEISQHAGQTIRIAATVAWTFPATTSTPAGTCDGKVAVAPSSNLTFTLQKDGTTIGTVTWTAGSTTTSSLTKASDTSFVAGDYLDVLIPSNLYGMSGAFSLGFLGTRP